MKRILFYIKTITLFTVIFCLGSCSEKPVSFVKRSTDALNFNYEASSETFNLRTNGAWSISKGENDWISISREKGQSDGEALETISVSVTRNTGEKRVASLVISAAGEDIIIKVAQSDGKLIIGEPFLSETFFLRKEIENTNISIPYSKAVGDDSFTVSVEISGEGAVGINSITNHIVFLTEGDGIIEIPIVGKPTATGEINFVVSAPEYSASFSAEVIDENSDPIGTVYFEEHFDKMLWGGDHVGTKTGIKGAFKKDALNKDIINELITPTTATDGTDGSSDFFVTMAESYRELRGIAGWEGSRVYERPGYIKMGTAASRDGYIMTPALDKIREDKVKVKVSFDIARWSTTAETSSEKVYIEIVNGGQVSVDHVIVTNKRSWGTAEFVVENATAETQIKFKSDPTMDGRFFIDNLIVLKIK